MSSDSALRRKAAKQGFKLATRDGGWMIVNADDNTIEAGGHPNAYGMSCQQVEQFLAEGGVE